MCSKGRSRKMREEQGVSWEVLPHCVIRKPDIPEPSIRDCEWPGRPQGQGLLPDQHTIPTQLSPGQAPGGPALTPHHTGRGSDLRFQDQMLAMAYSVSTCDCLGDLQQIIQPLCALVSAGRNLG